jgi:hypothetical protein
MISLRPSLITKHEFESNINELAREVAPRFTKPSFGISDWKKPNAGRGVLVRVRPFCQDAGAEKTGPIPYFLAVRRFGRSDRRAQRSSQSSRGDRKAIQLFLSGTKAGKPGYCETSVSFIRISITHKCQ